MSALAPQGGPPPGVPPQIQVGGAPAGPQGGDGPDNAQVEQLLVVAKAALQKAEQAETDHIDMATIGKCIVAIQNILAARQKGAEQALGTTAAHKAMARSSY